MVLYNFFFYSFTFSVIGIKKIIINIRKNKTALIITNTIFQEKKDVK